MVYAFHVYVEEVDVSLRVYIRTIVVAHLVRFRNKAPAVEQCAGTKPTRNWPEVFFSSFGLPADASSALIFRHFIFVFSPFILSCLRHANI